MKPYTEYPMCPKCQRDRNQAFAYCDGSRCQRLYSKSEHLHCTCTSCGYEWLMECADAERAELSPEEDGPPDEAITYTSQKLRCPYCLLPIELAISSDGPKALVMGSFAHRV